MPSQTQMKRVLVIGPAWVGDMIMAQSLFMTLKELHPDVSIDVMAPAWSLPLLERMPQIDNAISLDVKHKQLALTKRIALGKKLRTNQYTHAIVIPRSLKSSLVPFAAKIPVRRGYRGEMRYVLLNDIRKLNKRVLTQTVQRYVALAYDAELPQPPKIAEPKLNVDVSHQAALRASLQLDADRNVVAFMPGAEYGPAKQWPAKYYRELAGMLIKEGYQIWLFGSEKDRLVAEEIATGYEQDIKNLAGKTSLVAAIDLLALTNYAVCNDSGLMHVACATDRHVLAIYGSSTPAYTPPLSDKAKVMYLNKSCSPCFKRECPYGHYECLNEIKPIDVFNELTDW